MRLMWVNGGLTGRMGTGVSILISGALGEHGNWAMKHGGNSVYPCWSANGRGDGRGGPGGGGGGCDGVKGK